MEWGDIVIIRQNKKPIIIKTSSTTLTCVEMGDIVCNSATAITITLPSPSEALWYRVSNVGTGIVTVYYGGTLTTLSKTEQCLCLANSTTSWFLSKGGSSESGSYTLTKEKVEAVLTGEITSHIHDTIYYTETEINALLGGKVDNSRVLTDVPLNALFTDTIYTHPVKHPPSIIEQDASNRFVTDLEKAIWNEKSSGQATRQLEPLCYNFEILFSPDGDILMGEVI